MKLVAVFAVTFFWIVIVFNVSATTIWVDDDNVAGPWDGSVANPYQFIQDGINAAPGGETVIVKDGTYTGDKNCGLNLCGKAITVQSENGADTTIIDCEEVHIGFVIFYGEGPDSIVDGFTIRNGCAVFGGGIYCENSSPTIRNCKIMESKSPSIVPFTNYGGGMYLVFSNPTIINCKIINNRISYEGGGIACDFSDPLIINCTISGNMAYSSGGILCINHSNPTIINCILWDNGPYEIGVWDTSNPTIIYCDIRGGTGESWFGEGCIDTDPMFVADGYWAGDTSVEGDYHLTAGSLCIDAGTNDAPELPMFDLDGLLRIWTGLTSHRVDMGAYEYGSQSFGISDIQLLGTGDVELMWLCSDEGVTEFDVWYSDDEFSATMTWNLLEGDVPSGGVETMYVDTTASAIAMRYYKVSY